MVLAKCKEVYSAAEAHKNVGCECPQAFFMTLELTSQSSDPVKRCSNIGVFLAESHPMRCRSQTAHQHSGLLLWHPRSGKRAGCV